MEGLTKEKLEWLRSISAVDISCFNYMVASNGHLYSKQYLDNKTLEEIKYEYELLYSNS